jgi:hypothetical protein
MSAHAPHALPPVTHEAERIARAQIVWASAWVLLFSCILGLIAILVFEVRSAAIEPNLERPQPQPGAMVSNVRTDLYDYRPGAGEIDKVRQRRDLDQFSWVDRERGLVRIPIETAIDLELAEKR